MARDDLRTAILNTSRRLGISPLDLATAMSYETAGTFDPWKRGPTTKWGTHRGLIQWGEPQARQYGVGKDTPVSEQVDAAGRYLVDRGVRPGHGLLEIYSAINAGGVGDQYYGRSDAHAGGAPGSVRDKVNNQMAGHRRNAERLIGDYQPGAVAQQQPAPPQTPGAPVPPLGPGVNVPDRPVAEPQQPPGLLARLSGGEGSANPLLQMMMAAAPQAPEPMQMQPMQNAAQSAPSLTDFLQQFMQNRLG